MRNFVTKVNDTAPLSTGILDAAEDNARFDELENAVTVSGITLDAADGPDTRTDMLAESVTRHVGSALACEDSGVADAYVLSMIGSYVAPTALVDEMRIRWRPGNANTTASTLNAFDLGTKPLVDHALSPLSGGELETGREAEAIYRSDVGASGSWVIPAWANALYVDPNPLTPTSVGDGEGWSVNTGANTGNLNFPGLTNLATLDSTDVFARYVSAGSVNHHRGITYAQLAAALGSNAGGLVNVQLITTSSTYTKTTNTTRALVFATGGGGGGAAPGAFLKEGGGGGSGATAIAFVDLSAVTTVACLIGAGGAAGAAGQPGSNGGSTSFGSFAVAGGGYGGKPPYSATRGSQPGGAGGVATAGLMLLGGTSGGAGAVYDGGAGGGSFWGGGGRGGSEMYDPPGNGYAATAYGAGGGGADANTIGGAGMSGCILVLEFR